VEYFDIAKAKLDKLRNRDDYYILAIESSCDETAVSIIRGRAIISNIIATQIEIHKRFGGVVPEIASRNHILVIDNLVLEALSKANLTFDNIDVVAVTYGAGLLGALLVGVSYAKALAYSLELPLVAIDHIKGHICANFLVYKDLEFPFVCLLVSGGHTEILKVNSYHNMEVLGTTRDDAAGEAFDKVARVIGLPYPGGPEIEKTAKNGQNNIKLPRAFKGEKHLDFSYSGLKTAVINYVHNLQAKGLEYNVADIACSFQTEAVGVLITNALKAVKKSKANILVVAGGVGANEALREGLLEQGKQLNLQIKLPPKALCTDNAAMIGEACYMAIKEGILPADLSLDADCSL